MTDIAHNPPNTLRIEAMYAFISTDDEGNEGLCGIQTLDGMMMPLIAADPERVESLRSVAKRLAAQRGVTGKEIKLVKFATREELETITP